ncbi:MAG: hypothetical protein P1P85_02720 [Patescibacteria group bacterium]|nr:hypothetical protein [Patescibacteria group bacterium]
MTYLIGDLTTTISTVREHGFKVEGNVIVKLILINFNLNILILFKVLATLIACFSLNYCYEHGFPLTAIITSLSIIILSVAIILNNSFTINNSVKIDYSSVFSVQLVVVLLPLIILVAESLYKEKNAKSLT